MRIGYTNACGILGKQESARVTTELENMDIFLICESKIVQELPKMPGYTYINDWRKHAEVKGGGIGIYIREEYYEALEHIKIEEIDNMTLFRLNGVNKRLNIFMVYAPCDNKPITSRKKFFDDLGDQIETLTEGNDDTLIIGDFNAKLKMTKGDFLQDENRNTVFLNGLINRLQLHNNFDNEDSEIHWTFEHRYDNNNKSIIDYVFSMKQNESVIKDLKVDNDNTLTLYKIEQNEKKLADHNVITFDLKNNYINKTI